MAQLYYDRQELRKSNGIVQELLKVGKDSDDKRLLVEAFLLESKIIFESKNIAKARASLTACRANANQI